MKRGDGKSRINRVGISLANKDLFKLNRLATACNMKPTTLAGLLVEKSLNNAELIKDLQNEHCLYAAYKVIPINVYDSNELEFIFSERGNF